MNHQLFEKWLLDKQALNAEQIQELHDHMLACRKCQSLAVSWSRLEKELQQAEFIEPQPGFSKRWLASLPRRRQMRTRNLVRAWMFGLGGAALFSLIVLIVINTASATPTSFSIGMLQIYQRGALLVQQIRNFLFLIVNRASYISWIALAFSGFGLLAVAFLIWAYFTNRTRRGVKNETKN
jgi:hypothetical protein